MGTDTAALKRMNPSDRETSRKLEFEYSKLNIMAERYIGYMKARRICTHEPVPPKYFFLSSA